MEWSQWVKSEDGLALTNADSLVVLHPCSVIQKEGRKSEPHPLNHLKRTTVASIIVARCPVSRRY